MAELSLMASAAFSPGICHQDQALFRSPPLDFQAFTPTNGKRQNVFSSGCMQIGTPHFEDPGKFSSPILDDQMFKTVHVIDKPVLIDGQDTRLDSVLFSFGVAEQCIRQEKILKFLASGSNITDGNELNMSLISDLMGFRTVACDLCPQPHVILDDEFCLFEFGTDDSHKVIYPQKQLYAPRSLLDFVGNLSHTSSITVHPNGHVLLTGTSAETRDLLLAVAEFNLSKSLPKGSRKAMVVPYFTRRRGGHARASTRVSSSLFETQTVVPPKSFGKSKAMQKKQQNKNPNSERLGKNYVYACDCLFNMYLDNSGNRTTILSLKDSGPELTQLLSQISACIVGTGLAVLISVVCKAMNGRVALLSSAKLFNVTFGVGLLWLSLAVNKLRDTIYNFSKRSARGNKPNEAVVLVGSVRRSMNEILFRFATLMLVGVLCF